MPRSLHLLFSRLRFLQCCYLSQANIISSSLSHRLLVFSLFVSCLSIERWGIVFFATLLYVCLAVQRNYVRAEHNSTFIESRWAYDMWKRCVMYTTLKSRKMKQKKIHSQTNMMVLVLSFEIKCFQYEQLFSHEVHQVEGKKNNLLLVDCVFLFRLSLLYW